MSIYIHKNGQQYGPYSEQEAKNYISSGNFSASDLGWIDGAADWAPLSSLLSLSTPPPPVLAAQPQVIQVVAAPQQRSPAGVCIAGWILIALCCLGSLIPGLGFGIWLIGAPVLLVAIILGIVAITRGGTLQGVIMLLCALVLAPIFIIVAPIVTTSATIAASKAAEKSANGSTGSKNLNQAK